MLFRSITRRSFLRRTAAGSLAAVAFPAIVRSVNANGKLQVGVVGANGQGLSDLGEIGSHPRVQFVGFCDVDTARLDPADKKFPGVAHFQDFREMFAKLGDTFQQEAAEGHVRWIDVSPQQARLVESPLDIRDMLTEQRARAPKAWIFTSATLGDDDGLSWFTATTGLEDAVKLRLGSPFDYAAHARLFIPGRFPKPNEPGHAAAVATLAARCAAALGGRTFVLTTTLRALPLVAETMQAQLERLGAGHIELLVQGTQPKRALLQRFLAGPASVLIGSQTFWEGIDVPGNALQCVLIDKLPFPPPNDPLIEARVRRLEAQGRNPFNECFVADAAVSLKQGAGRLIRSESDRGLLVVCDPRMVRMPYGARLRAALPPMTLLKEESAALEWLAELALEH